MARQKTPAGLEVRLVAAERLRRVLSGERFEPFGAAELPDGRDRGLGNKLVTTALRRHGHLNVIIGELLDRGLPKKAGNFEAVLRLALAQLVFLPDIGAHSAIFLAVESIKRDAKGLHQQGLLNAVLRRAQANAARYWMLPEELTIPDALRAKWSADYGPDAIPGFAAALLEGAPLDLTMKDPADAALLAALDATPVLGASVRVGARDRAVEDLTGYAEGRWWVQDTAAAIPASLLHAPAGGRVLDLCAAPGGKTAQLSAAGYAVTALDSDAQRLVRLEANLARLGFAAETVVADATTYRPAAPVDAVLLDAPCSATGTFRRHPEVLWRPGGIATASRVALQRKMLANAAHCLNPGGVLVYCVCSLEREEGEEQARWAAATLVDLVPDPIGAGELGELAGAVTGEGFVRTHPGLAVPGPADGTLDGFFVARFRRRVS